MILYFLIFFITPSVFCSVLFLYVLLLFSPFSGSISSKGYSPPYHFFLVSTPLISWSLLLVSLFYLVCFTSFGLFVEDFQFFSFVSLHLVSQCHLILHSSHHFLTVFLLRCYLFFHLLFKSFSVPSPFFPRMFYMCYLSILVCFHILFTPFTPCSLSFCFSFVTFLLLFFFVMIPFQT